MRLLDRYLLRELCIPLVYCLAGFLIFWASFDLFSSLDEFHEANMGFGDIALYYVVRTPELLVTILPVALLLALLYALSNHGRYNELVAMRAAGQSFARISLPYLAVGLCLTAVLFFMNERLVPKVAERSEAITRRNLGEQAATGDWARQVNLRNARERRIWNIAAFNTRTHELIEPHVEWNLPDGSQKRIIARAGGRTNDHWIFRDVEVFHYPRDVDFEKADALAFRTNEIVLPEFEETPEDFRLQLKFDSLSAIDAAKRPNLSLGEIDYLRTHLELNARDRALLQTQYHARLAQPWTCMVVVLIALPFGGASNSRRNVFAGVASSIFICFAYFILLRFGLALGTGGVFNPIVAAWLPNVVFAALGLWLAWRVK